MSKVGKGGSHKDPDHHTSSGGEHKPAGGDHKPDGGDPKPSGDEHKPENGGKDGTDGKDGAGGSGGDGDSGGTGGSASGRSDDVFDQRLDKLNGFQTYLPPYNLYTGKNLDFRNDICSHYDAARGIDYTKLSQAAEDLSKVGTAFAKTRDEVNSKVTGVVGSSWTGDAADSFGSYVQQFGTKAQSVDGDIGKLSGAITSSTAAAKKIVDAYGSAIDQINWDISIQVPDLYVLIAIYKGTTSAADVIQKLFDGLGDLIGFHLPSGGLLEGAMDLLGDVVDAVLHVLGWTETVFLKAVAAAVQTYLDSAFKGPFENNLQLLTGGAQTADSGVKQAFAPLIAAAEAVTQSPFSGLPTVPEGSPQKQTGGGGGGHSGGGSGGGGGSAGGGGGMPPTMPAAAPPTPQMPTPPASTAPAGAPEAVKIHDGSNDIEVDSPDGQGHVKIKVGDGSGAPAKTYDVDFSKIASSPAVAGLADQHAGIPILGKDGHPVPGQTVAGGQPGVAGQPGVTQPGAAGQPQVSPDGSIPTQAGADGKAVIHDGNLTITAQQGSLPGEVKIAIDDGTGAKPHDYTIDYNDPTGAIASPVGAKPVDPSAAAGTDPSSAWTPPAQQSAGVSQSIPAQPGVAQPNMAPAMASVSPADWGTPPTSHADTAGFGGDQYGGGATTAASDQGRFSGSLFGGDASVTSASTSVAAAGFGAGAAGGQLAWDHSSDGLVDHGMVGGGAGQDVGHSGDQQQGAWGAVHFQPGAFGDQSTHAGGAGEAGLASVDGSGAHPAQPAAGQQSGMMGGMPMMGGGQGGGGGGEDHERSTSSAWRTQNTLFDDAESGISRINGVLSGEDDRS